MSTNAHATPLAPASRSHTVLYWALTGLLGTFMILSGALYLTSPDMVAAFRHLGFPDYFRVELGVAKLAGALALLLPVSARVKEWAYAGFAFTFVSAFLAHVASGDGLDRSAPSLVALVILAGSYYAFHRRSQRPGPTYGTPGSTTQSVWNGGGNVASTTNYWVIKPE